MEDISMERTSRRTPRKISENVRELHTALSKVLDNEDRTFLIQSLNQYQRERNVNSLVGALKSVLDTPTKKEVYPLLWQIIPHSDQEVFRNLWHRDVEAPRQRNSKSPARSPGNLRRNPNSSSLPDNLHRQAADSGIDLPNMTQFHSSKDAKYPVKRLTVKRPSNTGFGFCVRGGAEHGVGLYVSSVDENSVAEKEGLLPGDHVIQVNGTKFDGLTHVQAVKIIQHSKKLNLIVRSVGRVPDSFVAESACKWVDMRGRKVSPPPGVDSNGRILTADGIHKSDLRLLGDDDERKVNIFVEDGAKLGLLIRGGSEYGLGVYIAGVDPDCAADQAGLTAGDQILDVNGQSFLNITHKHAVKVLKSTKNMIVTLKDIGRLPFTRVTHDKTKWIAKSSKCVPEVTHITEVEVHSPSGSAQQGQPPLSDRRHTTAGRMRYENEREMSMFHHGIAGSQVLYNGGLPSQKNLLTEQARQILNENELGTLDYYLEEYCKGYITISGFALALFDLLNTPAKMSLITEIRSSVAPKDIDRFDNLVLKKEIEIMKSRRFFGNHMDDDRHSLNSYDSSVSSVSGRGSSSRSSRKGSLDGTGSCPITPPQVPEVLPPNVKVDNDVKTDTSQSYEVYEATLTFHDEEEQTFEDEDMLGLPNFLNINPMSLDLPETESTSVPSPVDVSTPLFTSSPMNEHNGQVSPTRTVGEATTSLTVGDNLRKEKHGKDSPPLTNGFSSVNIISDASTAEGHRITTYANEEVRSTGLPSPPKHNVRSPVDFHSKKEPQKSQSPTYPFIFPSTFQGSITDNKTSISALFESSATKQNNSADSSPREHIVTQTEVQPKNDNIFRERRQNDFIASPTDHDLRPEVAKLPGKKRLASWNEVQDETTLSKEATSSANDKRLPPVKPKPGSMATTESSCSSEQKDFGNHGLAEIHGDNLKSSEDSENVTKNSAVVEDRVQLLNHLSNSSSSSSTSSERQRSSAANNRKSWDGVRHPGESEKNQKVSRLEQQRDNKERSCSDSNLMNLPKEQQKIIQAKHKASQELFELHQQSKTKTHNANEDEKTNTVTLATRNSVQTPRKVNGVTESPFVVEVEKSSSSLGLILEGGSDMGSDVKIKAVKEGNFAAWKCGRLKAGQVLLQVDDTPLRGLTSGIAVLTLRHAYSNSDVAVLKLLVRDG